ILFFLQKIQSSTLSASESKMLEKQIEALNILETAADLITTDLVEAAEHRITNNFKASENTIEKLGELYVISLESFSEALRIFKGILSKKRAVNLSKSNFKDKFQDVRSYLMQRLTQTDEHRIAIYRFESEVLESIRRLHALARRLERKA
ncbi:MAG: hypothetical protein R3182_05635, partial [Draconibacterium sp.]|nr:hypothetical protein [Draconibacterium sp.]